jgi:hypothetical protein
LGRCANWKFAPNSTRVINADISYPIDPSVINVNLQTNDLPLHFYVNFPALSNVALDVIVLMDVSSTMANELLFVKLSLVTIFQELLFVYPNSRIGVVSFSDMYVAGYPYGKPNDFPYFVNQALTTDMNALQNALNKMKTYDGGDPLNSQLTALLAVTASNDVGWFVGSRKIIVLVTKTGFHNPITNSTVLVNNNGDGIVDPNENYPSQTQVFNALINRNAIPIVVTTDSLSSNAYVPLIQFWNNLGTVYRTIHLTCQPFSAESVMLSTTSLRRPESSSKLLEM